jgi:hypothetical protein
MSNDTRPLHKIARDIGSAWVRPNVRAADALETLGKMTLLTDVVDGWKTGRGTVTYFLDNARGWTGEHARKIKAELRRMLAQPA